MKVWGVPVYRLLVYGLLASLFFYFGMWLVYFGGTDENGTMWVNGYGFYGMGDFGRVIVFGVGIILIDLLTLLFYLGGFLVAGAFGYLTWFACFALLGETLLRKNVGKIIKVGIILAILFGSIIGVAYSSRWFGQGTESNIQIKSGRIYVYRPTDPFEAVDTYFTVSNVNDSQYTVRVLDVNRTYINLTFNKDNSSEQLEFKLFAKPNLNVGDQVGLLGTIPINVTSVRLETLACNGFYIRTEQCICEFRDSTGWGSQIAYARSSGLLLIETTGTEQLILTDVS